MADYTAVYEAANGVVEYLRDMLVPAPISKRELISLASPYEPESNQLTVYLYSLEIDPIVSRSGFMNTGINEAQQNSTALQAGLLITAHSNAPAHLREEDRCRIIGAAIQAVQDMPVLTEQYLTGSLAGSGARIGMTFEKVDHESMMKIWNNSTVSYKMSIAVRLTGVTIDSKRTRKLTRVTEVQIGTAEKERSFITEQGEAEQ